MLKTTITWIFISLLAYTVVNGQLPHFARPNVEGRNCLAGGLVPELTHCQYNDNKSCDLDCKCNHGAGLGGYCNRNFCMCNYGSKGSNSDDYDQCPFYQNNLYKKVVSDFKKGIIH